MNQSPTQLQNELNAAKQVAADLRARLPDLVQARARVAHWTSETVVDDSNRPHLETASADLKRAVTLHAEHQQAARRVDELHTLVGQANHAARMNKIAEANSQLDKAVARYDAMSRELCRVYRDMLKAQARCHATPGAKTEIPEGPHLPHLVPVSWMGTTADHIRDGSLHWLRDEAREIA